MIPQPHQPQQKAGPLQQHRRRRAAALMAACGLALVAALLALPLWLGSPGSLAWALSLAQRQWPTGLQVSGAITGSVSHGGTLGRVEWSNDTHHASCTQVVLAWQWQSLLQGHLQLDRLEAARCDITPALASTPRTPRPPHSICRCG
jgi:translocation and assembly module TamB